MKPTIKMVTDITDEIGEL